MNLEEKSQLYSKEVEGLNEGAVNEAGWVLIDYLDEINKDPLGSKLYVAKVIKAYFKYEQRQAEQMK